MSSIASSGVRLKKAQEPLPEIPDEESLLDIDEIKYTLKFLIWPALVLSPVMFMEGGVPKLLLYGGGALIGLMLIVRSFRSPETLLAVSLLYIPLARIFPATIVPGINGTNIVLLMLLFFWLVHAVKRKQSILRPIPGSRPMILWGALSALSGLTVVFYIGAAYLLFYVPLEYKAWIDQFIVYFAVLNLIVDGRMARRVAVYLLIGSLVVLMFGVKEMLEKQGLDSMEKSRVIGPQVQPNDFGAFLVYAGCIVASILAYKPFEVKRWLLLPWLGVLAKVLLATFSRGAYLAFGVGLAAITWFRGLRYVFLAVVAVIVVFTALPELIPGSLRDRMAQTTVQGGHAQRIDASSQTRLILWDAALEITAESPFFGKGFKSFQYFKGRYTAVEVHESDTHNMFLYISSQMGIPALIAFLSCLACLFGFGYVVWRKAGDGFAKSLGLAGTGMAGAVVVINMFGSRMVNIEVCVYVWVYLAILGHLFAELKTGAVRKKSTALGPVRRGAHE
jgi:O-antigen ligase